MSDSKDPLIGQIIADRYRVLDMLGEGGMGRVYLAEHIGMQRKSALKVMSPRLVVADDAIARFHREAANASRINHPNVAQIYDFGETPDGLLYLAMEFVEGETLRSLIERGGAIPPRRAGQITKQIADALAAAHHLGIVHRDLKPDNIMIAKHHDGSDWVKVVDFGIAKTVQGSGGSGGSQTVTTAGVSLGTPEYMSPEQLAGERLDSRTDLYSLGLVLFNMLTAELPYPRVTSRETLARRLTSRPLSLVDVVRAEWPPALQTALDKALDPEPSHRFASVSEFANDVLAATSQMDDLDRTVRFTPITTVRAAAAAPLRARSIDPSTSPKARSRVFLIAGIVLVTVGLSAGAFAAMRAASEKKTQVAAAPAPSVVAPPSPAAVAAAPVIPADTARHASVKHAAAIVPAHDSATQVAEEKPATKSAAHGPLAQPAPVAQTVHVDSTPAAADTGRVTRNKALARINHAWLNANGDSAAATAPATTDTGRIRIIAGDLQGHMHRALALVQQGELQKARGEYRDAVPVLGVLRELYSGTPEEKRVEQMLRAAEFQTVQACRKTMQDSTARAKMPSTFRCEILMPPALRAGRGRAAAPQP